MYRETMQKLRVDRRLIGRRDWISPADLERALAELPDVSDKISDGETGIEDPPPASGGSNPA